MTVATCVYCTETKDISNFGRPEHVIPKAFCRGLSGVLTLTQSERPAVCNTCNQYFGDTFDRALGRDSYEAVLRLLHGVKPVSEADDIEHVRLTMTLPADGRLGPLYVELRAPPSGNRVAIVPIPQARFPLRNGGFISFTELMLESTNPRANPDIDIDNVLVVWSGPDSTAGDRVRTKLRQHGIDLPVWREAEDLPKAGSSELDIEVRSQVDTVIARAIAKIAFNYLAWRTFESDSAFALRSDFDPIRRFTRRGEGDWRDFVLCPAPPILARDSELLRSTRGHLLSLEWKERAGIAAQVALFNDLTYGVALAPHVDGIWRDIRSGHHYDLEKRVVGPLGHVSRLIVP